MKNDFLEDFETFMAPENEIYPSRKANDRVLSFIKGELSPKHSIIMIKLILLQAFVGFLTMLVCPQFDLSIGNYYKFFHFLHHNLGPETCFALCGAIFMGPTAILSAYVLKDSEIWKIKNSKFVHYFFLSGISVLFLAVLGSDVYMHLIHFWILGALGVGILLFLSGIKIRQLSIFK